MFNLDKASLQLSRVFLWIAGGATIAIMLLAIGNIVLRTIYVPFGPTYELISLFSAITLAFALGYSQIQKIHVSVDILVERLPKRLAKIIKIIVYVLNIILFGIATWQLILFANRIQQSAAVSETLRLPLYPFMYAVALGFGVFTIVLLADLNKLIRGDVD